MSNEFDTTNQNVHREVKCKDCGAVLKYAPGTSVLKCEFCGAENTIATASEEEKHTAREEIDFDSFLASAVQKQDTQQVATVKCEPCGATVSMKPNVSSDHCPFCGSPLVVKSGSTKSVIKPKGILPFKIELNQALTSFRNWIKGLWFAPSDLKQYARQDGRLDGMYIPYWTYDSKTASGYRGERGDDYYVNETYTTTENGRSVTKTRQVKKTRWTPVSGNVSDNFDDVPVMASESLPRPIAQALEPWDLKELTAFNESFITGYRTESYQVDVKGGFALAKKIMAEVIEQTIRRHIGGDHQRIHAVNTRYWDVTFKHLLLPIWISAYKYRGKVYRFLINGRTGEVQGERPYSWIKIALTALVVLAAVGIVLYFGKEG